MPQALGFFTYSLIKEHLTSIVSLEGNKSYNRQSLWLKNNGFWIWGGLVIANSSKIPLSQLWTMSTFHMAWALLREIVFIIISSYHPYSMISYEIISKLEKFSWIFYFIRILVILLKSQRLLFKQKNSWILIKINIWQFLIFFYF